VLPSKGEVESGEEFEGGAVFDPMTGIEENVTVLDLKSLYPMCMTTINASPETKVGDEYDGEVYEAPNGTRFQKEPDGMMREMVEELLAERDKKKELRSEYDPDEELYKKYDRQQASVKVIMNSLYGVSGWDRFRLYDKDNAAAVTATGREVINFTEKVVEEMGYEVAYGDTDSVMISLGDLPTENVTVNDELRKTRPNLTEDKLKEIQAALNKSEKIEDEINERYNEFAQEHFNTDDHNFLIEFEKLYRRFIQAGRKKRYGGHIIWKEGKYVDDIDITGFEYQRSDIAEITKESQKKLIEMLVKGRDIEDVKSYLRDVIDDFQNGDIELTDIGIPSGIGKQLDNYDSPTAHARGAKYANMLIGTNFGKGSKPKRVYLQRVNPGFYDKVDLTPQENPLYREFKRDPDVICFIHDDQVPDEFEVNLEKMLQKTLQKPLSRVLKAVDVSWEDVKTGNEQQGLENFM
jgi:DNA polymerase I